MENNFNLKKFLTENKSTSNSRKLNENEEPDYYPNKEVQIFTYDDWEKTLATAYEKDGSTEVTVYDEGDDGDLKKLIPIDIDSFIDMLKSKGGVGNIATNAHPNNITASAVKPELLWKFLESLGFNFDKWTVNENKMKNNQFDLRKFLTENKNKVNEQLAPRAIMEFIAADNNGVSIAEFVKAIIDGAAKFNQEEAAYHDLDKRSEIILKAIGRQDLIGGTVSEEATREGQEDMVHEFINDLFAPGNARLHLGMPVKKIASYMEEYKGGITSQAVKDAMDTYDKLAADGTLQKDYDNGHGFLLPEDIPVLKKAFELIGLYNEKKNGK